MTENVTTSVSMTPEQLAAVDRKDAAVAAAAAGTAPLPLARGGAISKKIAAVVSERLGGDVSSLSQETREMLEPQAPAEEPKAAKEESVEPKGLKLTKRAAEDWEARHKAAAAELARLKAEMAALKVGKVSAIKPAEGAAAPTAEDSPAAPVPKNPGFDVDVLRARFLAKGTLDTTDYEAIEKAYNVSRDIVDLVGKGIIAQQRETNRAIEAAAGDVGLDALKAFAEQDLEGPEFDYYARMLESHDAAQVVNTVRALRARYIEKNGARGKLLTPTATGALAEGEDSMESLVSDLKGKAVDYGKVLEKAKRVVSSQRRK